MPLWLSFWTAGKSLLTFFFPCFVAIFKMKISKLYSWKNLRSLTWGQKVVKVKVGRSHCHSHVKGRENHTYSTSAQKAKQWATAFILTGAGTPPPLQNIALHDRPLETVHWGILYLWAWWFCGPLGAIVFTANINDCLRPVPMGILPVLCESWPTFTLWDQGQLEKQLISCLELYKSKVSPGISALFFFFFFSLPWVPLLLKHTDQKNF